MFKENKFYLEDIISVSDSIPNWDFLKNKSILITGTTGLIGTFLIDVLMYRNNQYNDNIKIYAVSRNKETIIKRFGNYLSSELFNYLLLDIQLPIEFKEKINFIIHGASNTHPVAYSTEPINTILLSVIGTKNILDFAFNNNVSRTVFLSTVEIYGENRGDTDSFKEDYCGYINCNTLRACYPEGKRAAEALCQAYIKEKETDIVIARLCRVYGPTMTDNDSKAIAQFIKNAVKGENIILKSKGEQLFSFCYVADICASILFLLLNGERGEAYNVSNNENILSLAQIANVISEIADVKVIYDLPSSVESAGFSVVTKALLDSSKLVNLGWKPKFTLKDGLKRTIEILKENNTTLDKSKKP